MNTSVFKANILSKGVIHPTSIPRVPFGIAQAWPEQSLQRS